MLINSVEFKPLQIVGAMEYSKAFLLKSRYDRVDNALNEIGIWPLIEFLDKSRNNKDADRFKN